MPLEDMSSAPHHMDQAVHCGNTKREYHMVVKRPQEVGPLASRPVHVLVHRVCSLLNLSWLYMYSRV